MLRRLYLAHSYLATHPDHRQLADVEVARWFQKKIQEFSDGRIEVITSQNPKPTQVLSKIVDDITSCDGILCLLTRRTLDHLTGRWLAPTYVLSEGAFTLGRFHGAKPVLGFVEEGVDLEELGIAFQQAPDLLHFCRTRLHARPPGIGTTPFGRCLSYLCWN
jgi:hypothetical protein